jgi:hypothetical protein
MSEAHTIRCYEYVNAPYERVREKLRADPLGVFQRATTAAAKRLNSVVASLRVNVGSVEIGTDVTVSTPEITEETSAPGVHGPRTRLRFEWRASKAPGLFPVMKAQLSLYPLSGEETQIDFEGHYAPPLGAIGGAVDALVGRRVAEASIHRFVEDLAMRLRQEAA